MNKVRVTKDSLEHSKLINRRTIDAISQRLDTANRSMNRTTGLKQAKKLRTKLRKVVALQVKLTNPIVMANYFRNQAKQLEQLDA